ncbi:MAG TPA: LacI family DNA-binding transcriptional regulator [Microlunatus sp.]|nr:LacI family DNA-binding transcriptional regulator [Microlunatus sp.]
MTTTGLATMGDVAALAGVSTSTVSRALRDSPLISSSTRERVRQAAAQLDFALSRAASALASGRLGRVGVLVGGPLSTWFNASVLESAYATLRDAGSELVIYRLRDAADRVDFFATLPARRNVDALVVASFTLRPDEYDRLAELSVPVVYLNQAVPGQPSVFIDDATAAATGTRHLINLGHRQIGYLTTRNLEHFTFSATSRFLGVRQAVDRHNASRPDDLIPEPVRFVVDAIGGGAEVGRLAVAQLLSGDRLPSAVVTETDEIAISLIPALQRSGIQVPVDVSVLGFDDSALAEVVDLTTIAQPVTELARRAAGAALTLSSEPAEALQELHQTLPTHLVLRGTTAAPRAAGGGVS